MSKPTRAQKAMITRKGRELARRIKENAGRRRGAWFDDWMHRDAVRLAHMALVARPDLRDDEAEKGKQNVEIQRD